MMIYASLLQLGVIMAPGFAVGIELTKTKNAVKDQYIVTLDNEHRRLSSSDLPALIKEIIQGEDNGIGAQSHGEPSQVYESVFTGFAAHLDATGLRNVLNNPMVVSVEEDGYVQAEELTWGLDRIDDEDYPLDGSYEPTFGNNGEGVTAYVFDTGILTSHEEFEGRATQEFNAVPDGKNYDCGGHGTHVAGTVGSKNYGVANKVKLVGVKVLDCNGRGFGSYLIAGINWVIENAKKPAVANMSLGFNGSSYAVHEAVKALVNAGVTTAVAAGNYRANACNYAPAQYPEVITVGATTWYDKWATFSNWGKCVDIWAPGFFIVAPSIDSNTAVERMSGTSMASPHVCGAAALYLGQNSNLTPTEVSAKMLEDSISDKVIFNGMTGNNNKFLYVGASQPPSTPTTYPPTPTPTTSPTTQPTPAPTPAIGCKGEKKTQCKKLNDFCVFGKNKIPGKCEPKKGKYRIDCGQFDDEGTCLKESEGNCMWDDKCTHRCEGLAKTDCKKVRNLEDKDRKMCKTKKVPNPCKGCQSKITCG